MRRIILVLIITIICISISGCAEVFSKFEVRQEVELPNSSQHENGTWWGYNQSKIVSIENTTFTYYIDNANQINGVANRNNPNKAVFIMIKDGTVSEFDRQSASRPCNVLADKARGKVYYIVVEPMSYNDNGSYGRTMLYEYDYDKQTGDIEYVRSEEVVEEGSIGKIRSSAAIDSEGNIIIAYGDYDGYMHAHIYDISELKWTHHILKSNIDNDSLLYPYVIFINPDEFYLLAVQDTLIGDECYYQYVKFFAFKNSAWQEHIVVDYRDLPIAQQRAEIVTQSEFYLDGEDVHIITCAALSDDLNDHSNTIEHYIYRNGTLIRQDKVKLSSNYNWIKVIKMDNKLYYVGLGFRILDIVDYSSGRVIYRNRKVSKGSYIYVNRDWSEDELQVMICPGNQDNFDTHTALLHIRLK